MYQVYLGGVTARCDVIAKHNASLPLTQEKVTTVPVTPLENDAAPLTSPKEGALRVGHAFAVHVGDAVHVAEVWHVAVDEPERVYPALHVKLTTVAVTPDENVVTPFTRPFVGALREGQGFGEHVGDAVQVEVV